MNKTTNYDQFKLIGGNRKIYPAHVKRLTKSIASDNLLSGNPIIVNQNMEVLDGQHRLEACKILKTEIYYVKLPNGLGLDQVHTLNNNQKNWSMTDYLESYASKDIPGYVTTKLFIETYKLPVSVAVNLLTTKDRKTAGEDFRTGKFRVNNLPKAQLMAGFIGDIEPYFDVKATARHSRFVDAIKALVKTDSIDLKKLAVKFSIYPERMHRYASITDYYREIEKRYNYKSRSKTRLF